MPRARVQPGDSGPWGGGASPAHIRGRNNSLDFARSGNDRLTEPLTRAVAKPVDGSRYGHRGDELGIIEDRSTHRGDAWGALGDAFHPAGPQRRWIAEKHTTARPFVQGQESADRDNRSELGWRLNRYQTQSLLASAYEELAALTGFFCQVSQHLRRDLQQADRGKSATRDVPAALVASGESVRLQSGHESIGCGPGQIYEVDKLLKTHRLAVFDDIEKMQDLVQDLDAAGQSKGHDQHSRMSLPLRGAPGRDVSPVEASP